MTITELRWTRWATFTLFFANGFGFGAWASAIPPLKIALGLSAASLSIALLAMAAGAVFMMQVCGSLTQHLGGTGRATRLASLVFAPVLMLPAMSPNLAMLIVAAALLGATSGLMDVAMNAHATVVEEQWRTPIMSSFHAGFSIGGLAGTGFGALLLAYGTPTRWLMVPTAMIVAILVLGAAPHLGTGENRHAGGTAMQLPERRLIGLAAIALFCFLMEGAMADWSGLYLTTVGVSTASAAAGYGAFSSTMVLGRLLGDRIVKAFGRSHVVTVGALVAAMGLMLAVAIPHLVAIVIGFALVGAGLSNVVPSLFSASARLGKNAASGIAAAATAGYAGLLTGPPLIGAVAAHSSLRAGMAVLAAVAFLAVIISLRSRVIGGGEDGPIAPDTLS
jgi:MFS family permease